VIRDRAAIVEAEAAQLIERLEIVQAEASALQEAEGALTRGLIADVKRERAKVSRELKPGEGDPAPPPSGGPPPPPAPSSPDPPPDPSKPKPSRADQAMALKAERREAVFAWLDRHEVWAKPPEIMAGCPMPRKAYQESVGALVEEGRIVKEGSRGSLRFRVAGSRGSEEPPEDPAPAPPPPPEPPIAPARSPGRARRRRTVRALPGRETRRPQHDAPPEPEKDLDGAGRSDGVEKPSRPGSNGAAPFDLSDEHREIIAAVEPRPLTAEGIAIKLRIGVAILVPLLQALVNARYLQRGQQGTSPIYGLGPRPVPAKGPAPASRLDP
jgi:hypothetical protein